METESVEGWGELRAEEWLEPQVKLLWIVLNSIATIKHFMNRNDNLKKKKYPSILSELRYASPAGLIVSD